MNIMPEIRTAVSARDNIIIMERINQLMGVCEDALKRYIRNLESTIEKDRKSVV